MAACLQPVLMPVKGAPDIVLSIDPKDPKELFVFLGMAMLEKVPHLREHPAFKMLLARLSNAGVHGRTLTRVLPSPATAVTAMCLPSSASMPFDGSCFASLMNSCVARSGVRPSDARSCSSSAVVWLA